MEKQPIQNDNKTIKLPILLAFTLISGILLGATFFGGNKGLSDVARGYTKYRDVLSAINTSYVDSVSTDSLVDYSIEKMLERLDPHTSYYPPQEAQAVRSQLEGGFDGIGIEFNVFRDTVYVITPLTGGPSEAAGIQSGDAIIRADGTNLTGKGLSNSLIFSKLRGKQGTEVSLDIKRRGQKKLLNFTVVRDKIMQYSVDASYMIDSQTGYLKVNRFMETTYDEFKNGLQNLQKQGMKQLILDLRGNPGGYMNRAVQIVDELVAGKDVIVYTDGKNNKYDQRENAGTDGVFEKGAIIVLIDEGSASASEIVSGALQDYDRALIVGRRSFGKGLVQQPFTLADGSELRLTISRYYIPSGRSIQKPYQLGHGEEYGKDMENRTKNGEYFIADSIKNNPKMKFKTKAGRVVYGGGGITPDVFVQRDTSMMNPFVLELWSKNVMREFALSQASKQKEILIKNGFKVFLDKYLIDESILKSTATNAGIKWNETSFKQSKKYLQTQLKALIARQIWRNKDKNGWDNEFYQIMANQDEVIKTALKHFDKAKALIKNK